MSSRRLVVLAALAAGCGDPAEPAMAWMPEAQDTAEEADDAAPTDEDTAMPEPDDGVPPDTTGAPEGDGETSAVTGGPEPETSGDASSTGEPIPPVEPPPFLPLYRIPTRVHMANSALTDEELLGYLTEMNAIWRSQAGICFEIEVVDHEETMSIGYDMWFQPEVDGYNGYYYGDHSIYVRDYPTLNDAPNPVGLPGARVAAHELGHALTLAHDQGSDDYLMRSGTEGWQIPMYQIDASRSRAEDKADADTSPEDCGAPVFE
ncbi:MAG: hypothetical protein AAF721_26015 [Myxococcota bacterium]